MCVNNLSKDALDSAAAAIEPATFQSQVKRPNHCTSQLTPTTKLYCRNAEWL